MSEPDNPGHKIDPETIGLFGMVSRLDERVKTIQETLLPMLQKTLEKSYETMSQHEGRLQAIERNVSQNAPGRIIYTDGQWFTEVNAWGKEWLQFKARQGVWRAVTMGIPVIISLVGTLLGIIIALKNIGGK